MPAVIVAVWLVLFFGLYGKDSSVRHAVLVSVTVVSAFVLLLTESLSLFRALTVTWVAAAWVAALVTVAFAMHSHLKPGLVRARGWLRPGWGRIDWLVAVTLAFFAGGTLATALLYPVMNWDSLAYHMPRVFFWLQNRTVDAYPTPEGRQLFSGVFASYLVTQLKLLSGGSDRLVNLVQWNSYLVSIVGVSLIAMRLGGDRRGQQVAAVLAATTPMALLQASTTQTDLTCAMWCVATAYFVLKYVTEPPETRRARWMWAALTGASLALAIHSKPTAYIYCLPLVLWLVVAAVRHEGWKRASTLAAMTLAVMLLLSAGPYGRNAAILEGDALALNAPSNSITVLQDKSPASLATNAEMNAAMLLGTPFPAVNRFVEDTVQRVVRLWGGSVENPQIEGLGLGVGAYTLPTAPTHHDVAPSPVTAVLLTLSVIAIVATWRRQQRVTITYLACVVVGFTLAASVIAWQPWINRLFLPPVLLAVPLTGIALASVRETGHRLVWGLFVALVVVSVAWGAAALLFHSTNKLLSGEILPGSPFGLNIGYWNTSYEELQLSVQASDVSTATVAACDAIEANGIARVGILQRTGEFRIYPLLSRCPRVEFGYVGETVLSDRIVDSEFVPQVILEIVPAEDYPEILDDGTPRGPQLMAPQAAGDAMVLLYSAP